MNIKEILTRYFASSEMDVFFEVDNIFFDENHTQRQTLLEFMKSVPEDE